MRITKIHIKNFKSFDDSGEQGITKLFSLIGKNNSGKSAFIDAIQCVWGNRKISAADSHKNNSEPISIKVVVESVDETGENKKENEVIVQFENNKQSYLVDGKAVKTAPSFLPKLLLIPAIRNPESEATAGKDSFLKDLIVSIVDLKTSEKISLDAFNGKTAGELSIEEIKILLEEKTKLQLVDVGNAATNYLRGSLADSDLGISIDTEGDLSKAIKYDTKITDPHLGKNLEKISVLSCGTGLQSMVIMALLQTYADLQKNEDSILLIEEPEVYLHPDLQRKMFSVLRNIAKRTQVIYTTHSPIMISDLWDNSVRLITRQAGTTKISEIDINSVIKELGIRYEDVLNPKAVVFVEGVNDVNFYKQILKVKYPETAQNIDKEIKFVETGGFQTIHIYALMNILLSANVAVPFFIIADSDGETRERRVLAIYTDIEKRVKKYDFIADKKKLGEIKTNTFPLSEYAIESYLLTHNILKELDSSITEDDSNYFIDHYRRTYEVVLKSGDKNKLRQTMKPKLLFADPNTNAQLYQLKKAFNEDGRFVSIRGKLLEGWGQLERSGKSPMEKLINDTTIREAILSEPISILENILKKTKPEEKVTAV